MCTQRHLQLSLIPVLLAFLLPASAQSIATEITNYFDEFRATPKSRSVPVVILNYAHDTSSLASFLPFMKDSVPSVREKAHELLFTVSSSSSDQVVRRWAVELLTRSCIDGDRGMIGDRLRWLTQFEKSDYSPIAIDNIRRFLMDGTNFRNEVIKIAAFLEMTDQAPTLRQYATAANPPHTRWAALIALARIGDDNAASQVLDRVKKLKINDEIVYAIFPDLVFTRSPAVIAHLIGVIHSDALDCLAADAEREYRIPCAYRVMEQLSEILDHFPVTVDETGDLVTDDYAVTLQTVRQWFLQNKEIIINRDRY